MTKLNNNVTDSTGHFDTMSLLKQTIEQGKDPSEVAYGSASEDISGGSLAEDDSIEEVSPLDEMEAGLDNEDNPEAAATGESESEDSNETSELSESLLDQLDSKNSSEKGDEDIEFIKVTDDEGRKKRFKVDFTDKDSIRKAFKQAAGMRKFQKERDTARTELTDIQGKYQELNDVYSKLNSAWEEGGVKAVVSLLGQGEEAWSEAVNEELKHRDYLANLTPNEKMQLEAQKEREKFQRELEMERKQREVFQAKIAEKEEQAALQSLESKLHPAFDRYRFAGKLGDEVIEHQFDEAVWNKVTQRLAEYPDNIELTQAIVDKEFRTVANNFRKMVNMQTEKKVQKTIERKKSEASQRAQVAAKKGLSSNADTRKFVEDMKSGNIKDSFMSVFTGKVKI